MLKRTDILIEGSYLYYDKEVNYSQEDFRLVHLPDEQAYHIYAEILSRVESGEFLKIAIRYEMNQQFHPYFVRVEKSLGNRYAQEIFHHNLDTQEFKYTFKNSQSSQDFSKNINSKHFISCQAFSTTAMFTHSKKIDPTSRTGVSFLGSSNEWTYERPPEEKVVFAEFKTRELEDFKINNSSLSASHLCLYELDNSSAGPEVPVEIFVSKHYAIPYQLIHGDQKIVIKHLKKNH